MYQFCHNAFEGGSQAAAKQALVLSMCSAVPCHPAFDIDAKLPLGGQQAELQLQMDCLAAERWWHAHSL